MEKTIERLIYEETEQRLKEMAESDYRFPRKADKVDVISIIVLAGACLALIIMCMKGVIV